MKRRKSRLKKSVSVAVQNTIKRFSKLKPEDRFALLEELGEWVFCPYEDIEPLDWLDYQKCRGSNE